MFVIIETSLLCRSNDDKTINDQHMMCGYKYYKSKNNAKVDLVFLRTKFPSQKFECLKLV